MHLALASKKPTLYYDRPKSKWAYSFEVESTYCLEHQIILKGVVSKDHVHMHIEYDYESNTEYWAVDSKEPAVTCALLSNI